MPITPDGTEIEQIESDDKSEIIDEVLDVHEDLTRFGGEIHIVERDDAAVADWAEERYVAALYTTDSRLTPDIMAVLADAGLYVSRVSREDRDFSADRRYAWMVQREVDA